jgi:hypothetical protein
MYKKIIFTLVLCCASTQLFAQFEFRSGLLLSGGTNHIWNEKLDSNSPKINTILEVFEEAKFAAYSGYNTALGYKFRLEPKPNRFFYDIDYFLGFKTYKEAYLHKWELSGDSRKDVWIPRKETRLSFYTSLNPSANYRINKYLYTGIGFEPTLYFNLYSEGLKADKFDMPVTPKIGVNLKYVELAISYKVGLLNTAIKSEYYKSFNLNDLQLQLYIPFQ